MKTKPNDKCLHPAANFIEDHLSGGNFKGNLSILKAYLMTLVRYCPTDAFPNTDIGYSPSECLRKFATKELGQNSELGKIVVSELLKFDSFYQRSRLGTNSRKNKPR